MVYPCGPEIRFEPDPAGLIHHRCGLANRPPVQRCVIEFLTRGIVIDFISKMNSVNEIAVFLSISKQTSAKADDSNFGYTD